MKNYILKISYFFILIFTINSCVKIPKIQSGNEVQQVFETKVMMENGDNLKFSGKKEEGTTTIVLVRHAEKMKDQQNPDLTDEGNMRAEKLKEILSTFKLNKIYSTDYNRTQQTAKPTSNAQGLEVISYNPRALSDFGNMLLEKNQGENILVVGHSNTTPKLLNHFMNETVVKSISELDYGNIYVVSIDAKGEGKVLLLRF